MICLYIIGGFVLNKPLISEREIILNNNIKDVWNVVVNNNDYKWRTGIKKIELLKNNEWLEYYDENRTNFTKFLIIEKKEFSLYSFKMENKNFNGKWTGEFIEINETKTKCIFTETIYIKNPVMRILAKLFWDLGKIQEQYFKDLKNKLEND